MSDLPQTRENVVVEEVSLNLLPGSGETQNNSSGACNRVTGQRDCTSCCHDKNYRRLTFCSIICGISCIGIFALINSVKAEEAEDPENPERAARFSQRAKKLSIISIVVWLTILALIPILMALVSYLLTLRD